MRSAGRRVSKGRESGARRWGAAHRVGDISEEDRKMTDAQHAREWTKKVPRLTYIEAIRGLKAAQNFKARGKSWGWPQFRLSMLRIVGRHLFGLGVLLSTEVYSLARSGAC
jgi:hypothetical protein